MSPTAFALRDPLPWPAFAGLVRDGEALGYETVFLPEITGRDTLVALGAIAGETRRLRLGTGIVPMDARAPLLTAMAAAAVQERSAGRLVLGLGTGPGTQGALERLRALIRQLRSLFAGEAVDVEDGPRRLTLLPPDPIPIWIAALGPKAVRMAAEVADGVLLNWCTPERVAAARRAIDEHAGAAGRDPADVTVGVYVRGSLVGDDEAATLALRTAAGEYASYPAYARQFDSMGLGAEARAAAVAHRSGRPLDVPGSLVRAVCLPRDPAEARGQLDTYRDAGADLPVVYPVSLPDDPGGSVRVTLERLAPR